MPKIGIFLTCQHRQTTNISTKMSIAQRLEEQKRYRESLVKASHVGDSTISKLQNRINELNNANAEGNNNKEILKLSLYVLAFHLQAFDIVLKYIEYPKIISPIFSIKTDMDLNTNIYSPSDLYDLLIQLPEDLTEKYLYNLCGIIDSFTLIEDYKQKDKEHFISSFEKVEDKQTIFKEFSLLVQAINLRDDSSEIKEDNVDEESVKALKEDLTHIMSNFDNNYHFEKYIHQLYDNQNVLSDELPDDAFENLTDDYKGLIIKSIRISNARRDFEQSIINEMVENSGFADFYKELYPKCLKKVQHDALLKERKPLAPIDFPEHLDVKVDNREAFLRKLYDELVEKGYIDGDRSDDFVYLLGGPIPCPDDLLPINWLGKHKYTPQAFFAAFCGVKKDEEFGWSKLNPIATYKEKEIKFADNLPKLKYDFEARTSPFNHLFSTVKEALQIS